MSGGDRVALVTGASGGIGRAVAAHLGNAGYRVAAAARSVEKLARLAEETGVLAVPLDVTDGAAVAASVERIEGELGPIDLLVNNAGIAGTGGASWLVDPAEWWRVLEVNVHGPYLCARAVLPGMVERRAGRIVNVASNAAFFEITDDPEVAISSAYMASKAALMRFTEALAAEARFAGVGVFAISPGTVKTEMAAGIFAEQWDDPDLWTPAETTAELVEFIGTGALDGLSGRYIHAANDDWRHLGERSAEVVGRDAHALRLTR